MRALLRPFNVTNKFRSSSTLKNLGLTFVATTFSILLTFGTSQFLDRREKRASGRQLAMNIILDMEDNIRQMDDMADKEESLFNTAQYVIGHINEVEELSLDTLAEVFQYLMYGSELKFNDSREKIFHSSQDTWKHINNPQFIDLVQSFYYERHQFEDYFNSDYMFLPPISNEEQYQITLQNDMFIYNNLREVLPPLLKEPRILYYLTFSARRQNYYREQVNKWRVISDQCKFLMGITDEDLEAYVDKSEHSGRLVKKSDLIGTWTAEVSDESEELTFKEDGTFVHEFVRKYRHYTYSGALIQNGRMEGKWTVINDTLIRTYYHNTYHYELDPSNVTYSDENKEEVEDYIDESQKNMDARNESFKNDTTILVRRNVAYINSSGQMVELVRINADGDEKSDIYKSYMVRKEE